MSFSESICFCVSSYFFSRPVTPQSMILMVCLGTALFGSEGTSPTARTTSCE
ncbi:hypothetical protein DPMN_112722 [Dreissena polymorpha]|uniref:Uncharacterized protein n=1 Tax=Dreissena polymorpha TaxID=45954 RepID=A0A9D4QQ05_DREPO|nr:hypothetical protein DPMN_112722 [Dreissena polymorpha]